MTYDKYKCLITDGTNKTGIITDGTKRRALLTWFFEEEKIVATMTLKCFWENGAVVRL